MLEVEYPMENGMVRNWQDMCHVWDYTFGPDKMDIDPKECKVWCLWSLVFLPRSTSDAFQILLTEPPMNPTRNREKMIEVMFEKYQFDATYIAIQVLVHICTQIRFRLSSLTTCPLSRPC